jgi:ribosome maturation factor RimP
MGDKSDNLRVGDSRSVAPDPRLSTPGSRGYTQATSFVPEPFRGGPGPAFFSARKRSKQSKTQSSERDLDELQGQIENRIHQLDPEIEVIALEQPAGETLRLYIDYPGGVDLALCERVTNHLRDLLETWSLEVSSPGTDRPLTKPEHFRRFMGHRVRVRTREAIEGQSSFTGTLTAADEGSVRIQASDGEVEIPHSRIRRSNLVPDYSTPLEESR